MKPIKKFIIELRIILSIFYMSRIKYCILPMMQSFQHIWIHRKHFIKFRNYYTNLMYLHLKNNAKYTVVTFVFLIVCVSTNRCFDPVWHEEPEMPQSLKDKIDYETCFCISGVFKAMN